MSSLVRGTLILTVSILISKFLGFIYVVPFKALVGIQGFILYNYAYQAYIILLSLTTMGIPLAVSKFVSKYNALGDYQSGRRLFISGIKLMLLTGFISFLLLFFLAPRIALFIIDPSDSTGNSLEDIIFVMRMISFALLIVPVMGLVRGYFQGHHSMGPTAVSQVVEQLFRIIFILIGCYFVLYIWKGSISLAVGLATFAAFVGAIAGLGSLFWYWRKRSPYLELEIQQSKNDRRLSFFEMYKEVTEYAIPFVFIGLAIPIYNFIDTYTINYGLMNIGYRLGAAEEINGVFGLVQKVTLIPVSLATAMGLTLIPTITKAFATEDNTLLNNYVSQSFIVIIYITLPLAVYFSLMSYPIYTLLFGLGEYEIGGRILRWFAPTSIMFAFYTITSAILQGVNRQKYVLLGMAGGILIKGLLNIPLLTYYEEFGPIIATNLGFMFSVSFNLICIIFFVQYKFNAIKHNLMLIVGYIFLSSMAIVLLKWLFGTIMFSYDYKTAFIQVFLTAIIFWALYLWLGIKSKLIFLIVSKERFFSFVRIKSFIWSKLTSPFIRLFN